MGRTVDNSVAADKLLERQKLRADRCADDMRWLLNDVRGRRLYWKWLVITHIFKTSMTGNSNTYFLEGERNVGLTLWDELNAHCPDAFPIMQREAVDEARQDRDFQKYLEDAQQKESI